MGVDTSSSVDRLDRRPRHAAGRVARAPATTPEKLPESFVSVDGALLDRHGTLAWIGSRSAVGAFTADLRGAHAHDAPAPDRLLASGAPDRATLAARVAGETLRWRQAQRARTRTGSLTKPQGSPSTHHSRTRPPTELRALPTRDASGPASTPTTRNPRRHQPDREAGAAARLPQAVTPRFDVQLAQLVGEARVGSRGRSPRARRGRPRSRRSRPFRAPPRDPRRRAGRARRPRAAAASAGSISIRR